MSDNATYPRPVNTTCPDIVGSIQIRDVPSWSRLAGLESEMADLRGKVAIMERNQGDFEATLARILRALPATD